MYLGNKIRFKGIVLMLSNYLTIYTVYCIRLLQYLRYPIYENILQ